MRMLILFLAGVSIAKASLYSGAEEVSLLLNKVFIASLTIVVVSTIYLFQVCSLSECDCVQETVTCTCNEDSSFQVPDYFIIWIFNLQILWRSKFLASKPDSYINQLLNHQGLTLLGLFNFSGDDK